LTNYKNSIYFKKEEKMIWTKADVKINSMRQGGVKTPAVVSGCPTLPFFFLTPLERSGE